LWTHNTAVSGNLYSNNDYAVYNYLGGVGTSAASSTGVSTGIPNGKIASGQSFFIKGLSNGVATFKNSMRLVGNNTQFFKMSSVANTLTFEKHRIWLDITNDTGAYKQTLIGYATGATMGMDRGMDGAYFNSGTPVALYSLSDATTTLSIQGRSLPFDVTDEVPLGFYAGASGIYTIRLSDYDGLFENQDIYIKDTQFNLYHDLKQAPYVFQSASGTYNNRFVLVYQNSVLANHAASFTEDAIVLYKPNQNLHVDCGAVMMKSITLYDVRGRVLFENKAVNATTIEIPLGSTNQVLLVAITSQDGVTVTKKYVN